MSQQIDLQTIIDNCAQQGGGFVRLQEHATPGVYDAISAVVIPDRVSLDLGPAFGSLSAFTLRFSKQAAPEYAIRVAGAGSQLLGGAIQGPSLSARGSTGVRVTGHRARVAFTSAHYFDDFGFEVRARVSEGTNANGFELSGCRAVRSGHGFYVNGEEVNAGVIFRCTAESNDGYGFFESGFLGGGYYSCHASLNPLGNYAQGGSIEEPTNGGVSNYSAYVDCYSEGTTPNPFHSAQVDLSNAGNLRLSACGWPDANGNPTPFPGTRSGYASKLRFEEGGVSFVSPGPRAPIASLVHGANREEWQIAQDWIGSPAWFGKTIALARHGKSGWVSPLNVTTEQHAKGPGRLVQGMPFVGSPFRPLAKKTVQVPPAGQTIVVQFDSNDLLETRAITGPNGTVPNVGELLLDEPRFPVPMVGAPRASATPWERIDENSVRTTVSCDSPNGMTALLYLLGQRVDP